MITAQDIQMSYQPAAMLCPVTMDKTAAAMGWSRRDERALRNRFVSGAKHGRSNPGSGVT